MTKKRILDYLVMHGYAAKTDEISGIDDPVKTRLRSYHDFAPLIPVLGEEAVEKDHRRNAGIQRRQAYAAPLAEKRISLR